MKKKKHRETMQRSRQRNGCQKELAKQRDTYSKNPQVKKNYYQENQEALRKAARDRAREKKNDSDSNLKKFPQRNNIWTRICLCLLSFRSL